MNQKENYSLQNITFENTKMQKEKILECLKERGLRITRQRSAILDVVLESECTCCKEICFKAAKRQENVGIATVYRMINTLEEIGAISRRNLYQVRLDKKEEKFKVILDDDTCWQLSGENLKKIMDAGLISLGYMKNRHIKKIELEKM